MDKSDVIARYHKLLDELDEPAESVVLSGAAALVVLGVRDETSDLDVEVPSGVFKWLMNSRGAIQELGIAPRVRYSPDVEVRELDECTGIVYLEGVWLYSPSELLKQKRFLASMPNHRGVALKEIQLLENLIKGQRLTARVLA